MISIAILSSFTIGQFVKKFSDMCENERIETKIFHATSYSLAADELLNEKNNLHAFNPRILIMMIDLRSLFPDIWDCVLKNSQDRSDLITEKIEFISESVNHYAYKHPGTMIILNNFEVPVYSPFGILDNKKEEGLSFFVRNLNQQLEKQFKLSNQVFIYDYDRFLSWHGKKNAFDSRMYYIADMRLHQSLYSDLASEYMVYINGLLGKSKKCLVLDLDNTLWGGIVGEIGFDNIKLGPKPPGNVFMDVQRLILAWYHRGIILAVNSRNNPDDVYPVFRNHPHMILNELHFSAMRINWKDKTENLIEIAEELKISTDSMVFIDDDSHNCTLVKAVLPEVLTIQVPDDISKYPGMIMKIKEFNTLQLTDEDMIRSKSYVNERQRKTLKQKYKNLTDFLRSLEMELIIKESTTYSLSRIAQLTQRTNQFNLTGIRYSMSELQTFHQSPMYKIFTVQVKDKLGDIGIVGAAIIDLNKTMDAVLNTFLLSCRALGKNIEKFFLQFIINESKNWNVNRLIGKYQATSKNKQTQSFFPDNGFELISEDDHCIQWAFSLSFPDDNVTFPDYVRITFI
ncbi:methoxymalonyl-ACP biosynthesis protein FkbH [Candidatus Magnetomorum sp. HK-1]|nr:methoxymalonyl-ACP biosynthesis protein FkbH [Candidatus Magnetomorum sp. HK-1]